jgi:hypothetical protein
MLIPAIYKTLNELSELLSKLSNHDYCASCSNLSNATIGQHTRHIIELFQSIANDYDSGIVNYDNRQRNYVIETNVAFAKKCIHDVLNQIEMPNKILQLQQVIDGDVLLIDTNYHRELLYNLEHCIHHQALIKVALLQLESVEVDENFGVARSTIEYRKQCVQ